MPAELRVSSAILIIILIVLLAPFYTSITLSQGSDSLVVRDSRGNMEDFYLGSRIQVLCFGQVELYLNGGLLEKTYGKIEFSPQKEGKYTAVCGLENRSFCIGNCEYLGNTSEPASQGGGYIGQEGGEGSILDTDKARYGRLVEGLPEGKVRWIKKRSSSREANDLVSAFSLDEYIGNIGPLAGRDYLGQPVTETAVGKNFVLSAYDTDFELVSHSSSPVSQKTSYRVLNSKDKNFSYVAIAASGVLKSFRVWHIENVTGVRYMENSTFYSSDLTALYKDAPLVEYLSLQENSSNSSGVIKVAYPYNETYVYEAEIEDAPRLVSSAKEFAKGWIDGKFPELKAFYGSPEGLDIFDVLDPLVIPEDSQTVYIYKVPHASGTWEYFEYETDNTPSKLLAFDPAGGSWWNDSWNYRQNITVSNSGLLDNITNYQLRIDLNSSNAGATLNWTTDQNSIRFTGYNSTNNTDEKPLYYWIEFWNSSTQKARIWVNVSLIPGNTTDTGFGNGTTRIHMYYRNPSASSESNGLRVFSFFDDFAGTSLNGSKWIATDPASVTVGNSTARINAGCVYTNGSIGSTPRNYTFEVKALYYTQAAAYSGLCIANDSATSGSNGGSDALAYIMTQDGATASMTLWGADGTVASYNIVSGGTIDSSVQNDKNYLLGFDFNSASQLIYFDYDYNADTQVGRNTYSGSWNDDYWLWLGYFTGSASGTTNIDDISVDWVRARRYLPSTVSVAFSSEENATLVNLTVIQPQNNSVKTHLVPFEMNGTINCTRGDCGNTSANAQFLSVETPTYTWTETTTADFSSYNQSTNVSFSGGSLSLESLNSGAPWWDTSWSYREIFNVSNTAGNLTDYPIMLFLNLSRVGTHFNWTADENATRFVWYNSSSFESIECSYWIESWNATSSNASVWVKMPFLENNTNVTLYMYYGNPSAQSNSSGSSTFNFFDHFTGSSLDSKWSVGANDYSVSNSVLRINVGAVTLANALSYNLSDGYALEGRILYNTLESAYSGTLSAQSSQYTQGSNAGSDATNLYMRESGARTVNRWTGSGSTTGYNCGSGVVWTSIDNTWYILGAEFNSSGVNLTRDRVQQGTYGCGWVRNIMYISLGYFAGGTSSNCQDTSYDWILIRKKASVLPTYINGSEQGLSFKASGYYISNTFDTGTSEVDYGKIYWRSRTNSNTTFTVYTRTSTNNQTWTSWFQQTNNSDVYADNNKYVQYRVNLSTNNSIQSPYLDEMDIEYKVSVNDWKNMTLSTALSASNPYSCGILNSTNRTCYPLWSITPNQVGRYAIRFQVNPASEERNITVMANTHVTDFQSNMSTQGRGKSVLLSARLFDDLSQPMSGRTIYFYDESVSQISNYDFSAYPASKLAGHIAYRSNNSGAIPPSTGPSVQNEIVFNDTNYGAINASDNVYVNTSSNVQKTHRFSFNVSELPSNITWVFLRWEGRQSLSDNIYIMLWNYNVSSWELFNQTTVGTTDVNVTYNLTGNFSNYINSSIMHMLVETNDPFGTEYFYTDYISADVSSKYVIGQGVTDSNGYAYVNYTIPTSANLGNHTLNASYNGSQAEFLSPSSAATTLKVSSVPNVTAVNATPNIVGFGYNVTISANVTDSVGIDKVYAYITYPNGTQTSLQMSNNSSSTYIVNFTNTWVVGTYSYYILANNTDGISNDLNISYFYVNVTASMDVVTNKSQYKAMEMVYLSDLPESWWNTSFNYRIPVTISNNISLIRTNEPVTFFVNFSQPAYNSSVRVTEGTNEIPSQVWNITWLNSTHMDAAYVTFLSNVTSLSSKSYYVYYSTNNVGQKNYTTTLNVTTSGNYIYFNTTRVYGRYSIDQDAGTTADDDATFQSFRIFNGSAWNDIMGSLGTLHQGIDRFDYAGYGGGGGVSLDWTLYVIENGSVFVKVKVNATDAVTSTTYNTYLTFYDKSNYAVVSHEGSQDSIQVYDVAGITVVSGDGIWVDDSDQNMPAWTDAKYAVQPTKYISYLRSSDTWGFSIINPPPDGNPSDGNSFELGIGIDSGVAGLRIDGRGTGEQKVHFPYTFHLAGITSGNAEVNETYQRINNPLSSALGSDEERSTGIKNTGSTAFRGYLWMLVQTNITGAWENVMPPVVNDRSTWTLREINASSTFNLSQIWLSKGAWNTSRNDPGTYRVYAELQDPNGNVLVASNGSQISDYYEFQIISSELRMTDLKHENNFTYSINEYEVGDNISWINVTVTALNNTALDANITLNLLNGTNQTVSWGPNETKLCGDIPEGSTCEKRWDNGTNGYIIPLNATPGSYTFYWNVSMMVDNGNITFNRSVSFTIHNMTSRFRSNLTPTRIYKPDWSWYNVTINNSWSKNITSLNVTINCPAVTGMNCSCALVGQSGDTCVIGSLNTSTVVPFNVSANNSTANNNYQINATVRYINPGNESRVWDQILNRILEVREFGVLEIVIYSFPANVQRSGQYNLSAYINNTAANNSTNIIFKYTLPSGWTNVSGNLSMSASSLCPNCILWNNITVSVGSNSALGPNEVRLDSECTEGRIDWKLQSIDVYSNTSIINFNSSKSKPNKGETIMLQAKLIYDNSTGVSGENIVFRDETDNLSMGSNTTNSLGVAYLWYLIPDNATLGQHILNATYLGSLPKYLNSSYNMTTIEVGLPPNITSVNATPSTVGYGYNVTISANVTDADGISKVYANITYPNGTKINLQMTNYSANIYQVNFTDTWKLGNYSCTIWANDTTGGATQSSTYYFYVRLKGKVNAETVNLSYPPNSFVNLTTHTSDQWWNFSWRYKLPVNITSQSGAALYDYQTNFTVNTQTLIQNGKMNSACNDTRIIYFNITSGTYSELPFWVENGTCNTTATNIWVRVPYIPNGSNTTVYMYYGRNGTNSTSNSSATFEFFDDFANGLSQWTIRSGDESYMKINSTLGNPLPSLQHTPSGQPNGDTRGRSSTFTIENATIEYDVYLEGTGRTIHQFFFRTDGLGFNSGYAYRLQNSGGDGGWFRLTGGSWSKIGSNHADVSANTWHHVKLSVAGSNLTAWIDSGSADSVTDANKTTSDYIGSHTHGTSGWLYDLVDNVRVRKYASAEPRAYVGGENSSGSAISNDGNTSFRGYMLILVQKNVSGSWQNISVVVNDTNTSTIRTMNLTSALDIGSIWNSYSWYTNLQGAGVYRVYAVLTDAYSNALNSDSGWLNGTYQFNISSSSIQLNITEIRIYNVTDNPNKHIFTGDLEDYGINKTFTLRSGNQYRIEILVTNPPSSAFWNINTSNMTHSGLNSTWNLDSASDVWYSNTSTRSDTTYTGGMWSSGQVKWNASLNGTVYPGGNVTFFYVVNISTDRTENYQVNFRINSTEFINNDYSIFRVLSADTTPPALFNSTYNLTASNVTRGNSLAIYARWNESIYNATAEYNSTTSILINYTITLPSPNAQNWTNYTMSTTSFWALGNHSSKIYATDEQGNWNMTLQYLNFTVYGLARVTEGSLNSSTVGIGEKVLISCRVLDNTNTSAIQNYIISFYNSTGLLGTNQTNSTGWATYVYTANKPGPENITCNITQNLSMYYIIDSNNYKTMPLTTRENETPMYSSIGPTNGTLVHKNDSTNLYAYWTDNYLLGYAVLSTNETGSWANRTSYGSPKALSGNASWSNFTWANSTFTPGLLYWRIYANDSFGNTNVTDIRWIDVWGWSEVSDITLTPQYIYVTNTTTIRCRVRDANSLQGIGNYTVYFYNSTGLLGTNQTNSTGWVTYYYTDYSNGTEYMACNITHNSTARYNVTANNSATLDLHTANLGEDNTPPQIAGGNYGLNVTESTVVYRGQSVLAYAQWTESIGNATIEYNSTNSTLLTYNISGPYTANWTNYTISTNNSWLLGAHYVKIKAADQYGNWNNTLEYKIFYQWGRAGVTWVSPTGQVLRGVMNLTARVTDSDTGQPIANYTVYFYDHLGYLGWASTNSTGYAVYEWNATGKPVGPEQMSCQISDENSLYYKAATSSDTETITLMGQLNATIISPSQGSVYSKGQSVQLDSTTKDEYNNSVSSLTATWNDSSAQIASGENTTWQIPSSHVVGNETIKVVVSKQYYYPSTKNTTIQIWGWSNASWQYPQGGNASVGSIVPLVCKAIDANNSSGIQNYPISFYYKNETEPSYNYIGTNTTGSLGNTSAYWNTSGLPVGNYTVMCNLTHNSTIYYNSTSQNKANTSVNLVQTTGSLEVYLELPPTIPGDGEAELQGSYLVGQNRTFFLKANVTCRGGSCGTVQGTVRYNASGSAPDKAINTSSDTPLYVVGSPAQNPKSCGNLNQDESCTLNWTINSTGALHSVWSLDVLFEGTSTSNNDTSNTGIEISIVLIMSLSNNSLNASVEPQLVPQKVLMNGTPIYVSIHENSNNAEGIYLKGTNLSGPQGYNISVENMSYYTANLPAFSIDMTEYYQSLLSPAPSGTNQSSYYWILTPQGVTTGTYTGFIYIMANATS